MSDKSIRNKEAILRHCERERALGRPAFAGFAFAFAAGVVASQQPNEAEALLVAMRAESAPRYCPVCAYACSGQARDPNGDWTWRCAGGCNP